MKKTNRRGKKKEQIDPKPKLELCSFVTKLIRQSSSAPRSSTQLGPFTPQIPFIWNRVFEFYNSINPLSYFVSLQNLNFLFLVLCSTSLLICALLYLNLQHFNTYWGCFMFIVSAQHSFRFSSVWLQWPKIFNSDH